MKISAAIAMLSIVALCGAACARDSKPREAAPLRSGAAPGSPGAAAGTTSTQALNLKGLDLTSTTLAHDLVVAMAMSHSREALADLLAHGVSVDAADPQDGATPLHEVALEADDGAIALLLDAGAAIDVRAGPAQRTALYFAAGYSVPLKDGAPDPVKQAQAIASVRVLLAHGADPNAREAAYGFTALHELAVEGDPQIAKLLLEAGAQPSVGDVNGVTPLHLAAQLDRMAVVQLLVEHGANVNARSAGGKTPLTAALQQNRGAVADYLRAHGGTP